MIELAEYLVRGALLGVAYGLLAFPVSLLFITAGSVDVALGGYAVLSAAVMYTVGGPAGAVLGIGAAMLASFGVGLVSLRLNKPGSVDHVTAVLATFGLSILLESFVLTVFGADPMVRQLFESFWNLGGLRLSPQSIINVVICGAILLALYFVLQRTPLGRAMRASAINPRGAVLNGIPVRQLWLSAYGLGGLLAGVAGLLILYTTGLSYSSALTLSIWGFGAAIIFGLRTPLRGFAGGVVIGIIQALCSGYLVGSWATAVPLLFILVVLSLGRMNQIATSGGRV